MTTFAEAHAKRAGGWHPGRVCSVRRIREALPEVSRDELDATLADTEHESAAGIALTLREMGHHITAVTIARHRRGECQC